MAKIKHILICSPHVPFVKGGTEFLIDSLYEELLKREYHVDRIIIPFQWHPKKEIIKNCMVWRLLDLARCEGKKVDLIISTKFPSYLIKHPNKVTYLIHQFRQVYDTYGTEYSNFTNTPEDNKIKEMIVSMDNKFLPESKKIFTISKNVSNRLKQYNDLDSEVLYPPPRGHKNFYNQEYGDYMLYVGRLNRSKRVDLLIRSLTYTHRKVTCLIAGTGEEMIALKNRVRELKLDDRVKLLGYVSDAELSELYANCFGVFYAPYDEDYGFATVEAFLSRKPVITTIDSGGAREFVEDGITGYVTINDPKSLAEKIDLLFLDKGLCRRLGNSGYEKVMDINISWDKVIERLTYPFS
ncbi:MAG: glycosyltransferase [Candidatus Aenigmarchaeota archaeon]|nr:glycosyltransferase [Candidatus Aenigmarchaeota archaeon]